MTRCPTCGAKKAHHTEGLWTVHIRMWKAYRAQVVSIYRLSRL